MRSYTGYEMLLEVWFWDMLLFKLQFPYLLVLAIPTNTDDTCSISSSGSRHMWQHFWVDFVHLLFVSFEFEYSVQLSLNMLKLILYTLNKINVLYLTKFCFVME
uniref:Uncharacterized protein n=2 Tax=Aegilops tauschii subsp. strangulata TaxID=200361 RepID=A0A453PI71_AEGTS